MQPILFMLSGPHLNLNPAGRNGVPPSVRGAMPLPTATFRITGLTRNSAGAAEGGFTVYLMDMTDGVPRLAQTTISDASGNYEFSVGQSILFWAVSYKAGAPDKAGASVNTLVGV